MFLHDMTQSFSAIWFLRANINKFKNFHLIGWRLIYIPLKCTTDRSHVGPPLNISITKFVFVHVQLRHWILQSDWMTTYISVYFREIFSIFLFRFSEFLLHWITAVYKISYLSLSFRTLVFKKFTVLDLVESSSVLKLFDDNNLLIYIIIN